MSWYHFNFLCEINDDWKIMSIFINNKILSEELLFVSNEKWMRWLIFFFLNFWWVIYYKKFALVGFQSSQSNRKSFLQRWTWCNCGSMLCQWLLSHNRWSMTTLCFMNYSLNTISLCQKLFLLILKHFSFPIRHLTGLRVYNIWRCKTCISCLTSRNAREDNHHIFSV